MSHLLSYLMHLKVQRPFEEPEPSDPPGASGQPQITDIDLLNGDAEITVEPPLVENAEWIEWFAGSNVEHWENGTSENPNISFTMNEVVFTAPRQEEVNDNSFFCYRGVNEGGSGPTTCNGFTIPGQDVDPDELGAPEIHSATALFDEQDGPSIRLSVTGGQNADDHDVHREQGDQDFTAGPGNLIDQDIDQAPDTYTDNTVQPVTTYSYRLMAKKEDQTSVPSNRVAQTSLGQPVGGDYPNLPSNFTDLMFQHDCRAWPVGKQDTINASGFGRIIPHSNNWNNNNDGNDGGTFTGAIEASRYARSGPAGHPHVEHGDLAPHGHAFCHRVRYSRGGGTGKATGGGSQCFYRMPAGTTNDLFRAIYMHFWVLYEGFDYDGADSGPTRVIQGGSQYRLGFQSNNCLGSTNQGGLIMLGGLNGTISWGVDADTGGTPQSNGRRLTHAPIGINLGSVCRNTAGNCTSPHPGPQGLPGTGAPGNGLSSVMFTWGVGGSGNGAIHNSSTRVPNNTIQIGRWHRIEIILRHSDVNTENGSIRVYVDTELVGVADPITTRWSNFSFDGCGSADGWYRSPNWYRGFHPSGTPDNTNQLANNDHNRYASFADFFYAGILV